MNNDCKLHYCFEIWSLLFDRSKASFLSRIDREWLWAQKSMSRLMTIQMDWWSPVATFTRINLDELYPEALKSAFCCWAQVSPQQPKSIYYEPWMAEFQIEKLFELIIRTSLNSMSALPGHFSPSTSTESTCDSCQPHLQAPIKGSFNFVSWQRDSKQQCWDSQATRGDIS